MAGAGFVVDERKGLTLVCRRFGGFGGHGSDRMKMREKNVGSANCKYSSANSSGFKPISQGDNSHR
jgi:hypothetical protein